MPVSASGDNAARASMARRTSSSQSNSSGRERHETGLERVAAASNGSPSPRAARPRDRAGRETAFRDASARCSSATARRSSPTAQWCSAAPDRRACRTDPRRAPARTSVPAKQLPGSMRAKKLREVRSIRFSVRFMKCTISRTSQWSWLCEQDVVNRQNRLRDRPASARRRFRSAARSIATGASASSSSRNARNGQNESPCLENRLRRRRLWAGRRRARSDRRDTLVTIDLERDVRVPHAVFGRSSD